MAGEANHEPATVPAHSPNVIPAGSEFALLGDEWVQLCAPGSQKRLTVKHGREMLILGQHS
jgi:hypothetical protein